MTNRDLSEAAAPRQERWLAMRSVLCAVLAVVFATANVQALTSVEIDAILEQNKHQSFMPLPYVEIGTYELHESVALALMVSGSDYRFGLQSCRQWIPTYLYLQQHNREVVDRSLIDSRCLTEKNFLLLVVREDGTKVGDGTRATLHVDGRHIAEVDGAGHRDVGTEGWTAAYGLDSLHGAKKVELSVYLEGRYLYRQTVPGSLVKKVVGE